MEFDVGRRHMFASAWWQWSSWAILSDLMEQLHVTSKALWEDSWENKDTYRALERGFPRFGWHFAGGFPVYPPK